MDSCDIYGEELDDVFVAFVQGIEDRVEAEYEAKGGEITFIANPDKLRAIKDAYVNLHRLLKHYEADYTIEVEDDYPVRVEYTVITDMFGVMPRNIELLRNIIADVDLFDITPCKHCNGRKVELTFEIKNIIDEV